MALETPAWLSADFINEVLRKSEKDESICVVSMTVKNATNTGDNYGSDMHRASVIFTTDRSGGETEKISIIVKIVPKQAHLEQMVTGLFVTEMSMMSDTLVKMNRSLASETTSFGPRCLYTQLEKPIFLVMEDLVPLGFRMADRQTGLDLAHCLLAIRGIGKFHASSVAVHDKDPADARKYNRGSYHKDQPAALKAFYTNGTKALGVEVAKWPELGPRYSEKIMKLSKVVFEKGGEAQSFKEGDFNVINHGDLWVNNMLFRYDDEGNPTDIIFVDFQESVYSSPAIDLLHFLNTSLSEELYENSQELLLREYYSTLTETMMRLNCDTKAPSYEELKKSMKERAFYGMVATFTILPLVLNDKSSVVSLDEMVDENNAYENPAYQGKLYRKAMQRLIPIYDKMGLLDL